MVIEIALLVTITVMAVVRLERSHDAPAPVLYGPLMVYGRLDTAERH